MTSRTTDRPRLADAGQGRPLRAVPQDATAGDITALWADAQIAALRVQQAPAYGSVAWLTMQPDAPERTAAIIRAAESWRQQQAYEEWLDGLDTFDWYAEVFRDARAEASRLAAATGRVRSARELRDARAAFGPIHQLKATPGWPPIAIPGQPGRYLTHGQETDE